MDCIAVGTDWGQLLKDCWMNLAKVLDTLPISSSVVLVRQGTTREGKTMHATTIVGYTYQAELLCPDCTLAALPTGPGEAFDGWRDMTGRMTAEENLSELALAFGIDRMDESSFDSGDFPKVVFASDMEGGERCGSCGESLI